jgi:hypothetical protein
MVPEWETANDSVALPWTRSSTSLTAAIATLGNSFCATSSPSRVIAGCSSAQAFFSLRLDLGRAAAVHHAHPPAENRTPATAVPLPVGGPAARSIHGVCTLDGVDAVNEVCSIMRVRRRSAINLRMRLASRVGGVVILRG